MTLSRNLFLLLFSLVFSTAFSQKIVYSDPEKDDTRRLNFEIAGKVGNNLLIYKNIRNQHWFSILDNEMKTIGRADQDYMPNDDHVINVDFFPYTDFLYMVYQYQKKNVVYCNAVKIDANGKKTGDVITLDTTHIGFAASNKIYSVESSEDKSHLLVFKINSRNKRLYLMTTLLYNDKLELQHRSELYIPMDDRSEFLTEFHLDNEGDLVFTKFYRNSNDNITQASLVLKGATGDSLAIQDLNIEKTNLDEIHIKIDNPGKKYYLTSFYFKERRGNIEGLYFYVYDKNMPESVVEATHVFTDDLKKEAKGDASEKMAFNDYFIRNLITRRDGGFIIGAESYYTTSRFNNWNRWDYLSGRRFSSPLDNYYYSPYYNNYYWWNNSRFNNNQSTRYHADNIAVLSFNKEGKVEWTSVLAKEQYDDDSDDMLSYQLMNTGGQLHFLFNQQERRSNLLNDYSISPKGELMHNPTLKNLDKGYDFMPKYAKQVSARQMIIPCQYHNFICFAKVEYN
jgi:hypothetical protein